MKTIKYISTDKQSRILSMFCTLLGHKYVVTQQIYVGYKHYGYTKYVCKRCKVSCQEVHDDFPMDTRNLGRWDPLWGR